MDLINKAELITYHNRCPYRKLQDLFPFHSTVAGLNGVYVASDDGKSFYINTPCVVAHNKTIIKGKTYLLLDIETDEIDAVNVRVLDAFYKNGNAYILVQDIETNQKRVIDQFLESHMHCCPWFLIDLHYLRRMPVSAKNHGNMLVEEQELLKFDF